jgi:phenylpropionate dioxygenase-like ring-hydroxylating dioxygenase large terminal subunit
MNSLLSPKTQKNEKPVNRASWLLPAYAYSDSNIYSQEIEKIFKKEWLYAAHVSSLRKPGDFLTLTLADQPLLVVCDKSNRIRTFYNICRHRGAAIASGSGNAETFSCPYHAWTYDCGGRLTTAPLMDQAVDFDPSKIRLREVRTEVFNGLVFINFDEAAPGLIDRITDLDAILKPWPIADMVPAYRYEMVGDFNWKLLLENGIEGYHIIAAHRQSFEDIAPAHLTYSTDNKGRYWSDLHTPYAVPLSCC